MADVKWIKMATNLFDNRKIRQIECLPEGYAIIVVWMKLLCLAGNVNDSGYIYFTKEIPYTEQMLSAQFNMPITTLQLALRTFEQFGMVEVIDDILHISNWEKYQSVDRLNEIREYNRLAKQKSRAKQKLLQNVNDMSMTSQSCHDIEEDKDKELDKEIELEKDREEERDNERIDYQQIADLFNSLCPSFPSIKALSDARKKAIKARLKTYSIDDFKSLFLKAESSSFLKGSNDRNWSANFDWLIKDANMAKVLDGDYDNRTRTEHVPSYIKKNNSFNNFKQRTYDFDELERKLVGNIKKGNDDP